ncbi:copper chaperone PCu(A)C [Aromatoleum toluclasticum]|uniref:copper chaperone PCu(A)C n=1 Tax=Aromatoleum toluclasticum TaxID=92003 RepID=UPI0003613C79|nr:copper chaperone PCu(A)C [Aromatoleum toluclasticum]MCC4116107.1 copper chaperone PCu(A)C [Aromatoleum toluclasticum]
MNKNYLVAALALIVFSLPARAEVRVEEPWVRATVPHQKVTGAFMRLTASTDAKLVAVNSPVAGTVEIHEMAMDKEVMKMRPTAGVALPAGRTVELKPGAHHVMLLDLRKPLQPGDTVPLVLTVEGRDGKRETLEVTASVRPLGTIGDAVHAR